MKRFKKILLFVVVMLVLVYAGICIWFYTGQENALFTRVPHPAGYVYKFDLPFEEKNIVMADGNILNGVLFKADTSKGLILWLPGGRGMLDSLSEEASFYTKLNYDVFIINYRGFGKSQGTINSEEQFNNDMQSVYNSFKKKYHEDHLIVYGYSLGSGPAASLAAHNHPKMLMLLAPYYSMQDLTQQSIPYLPMSLLLKYRFNTSGEVQKVTCPIVVFHGDADTKIKVDASLKLKNYLKPQDQVIILPGQSHNNFTSNKQYLAELKRVLSI